MLPGVTNGVVKYTVNGTVGNTTIIVPTSVNRLPSPVIIPTIYVPEYLPTTLIHTVPFHTSIVIIPYTFVPSTVPTIVITPAPFHVPTTIISKCAAIISHYTIPSPPYTV